MPLGGLLRSSAGDHAGEVQIGGRLTGKRVFVPLLADTPDRTVDQVRVGLAIGAAADGSVRIEDPSTSDSSAHRIVSPATFESDEQAPLEWAKDRTRAGDDRVRGILDARRTERRLRDQVRREEADVSVLPRASDAGSLGRRRLRRLAARAPCDVVWINGDGSYQSFASILLPIAEGPHSGVAADVAAAVAERVDAHVDILHVLNPDGDARARDRAERRIATANDIMGIPERTSPWILESPDPVGTIVEQSTYYGLTVIGAPTAGRLKRWMYGSRSHSISDGANNMVIAAKAGTSNR